MGFRFGLRTCDGSLRLAGGLWSHCIAYGLGCSICSMRSPLSCLGPFEQAVGKGFVFVAEYGWVGAWA